MESSFTDQFERYIVKINRTHLNLLLALGFLIGYPFYLHQINPDAIAYIGIAKQYMAGNFFDAINGYWSPLISWLLIPFLLIGVPGLLALKLINLTCGLLALNTMYHVLNRVRMNRITNRLVLLLMIPHLLTFILVIGTPDILGFESWLLVALIMLKLWNKPNYKNKMLLALLGIIAYLARYYHFYIFILSCVLFVLLGRKRVTGINRQVIISLFAFIAVSSCWMLLIDFKYDKFTPTLALEYNLSQAKGTNQINLAKTGDHLLPMDYTNYWFTSWEDPSAYPFEKWSPFENTQTLKDHLSIQVLQNIIRLIRFYSFEFLLGLLALGMLLLKRSHLNSTQWLLFILAFIYPLGYLWTISGSRYILFTLFSGLALSLHCITHHQLKHWFMKSLAIALLMGCLIVPLNRMIRNRNSGNTIYVTAKEFNQNNQLNRAHILSSPSTWWDGLYLTYFVNGRFYDSLKPEVISAELDTIRKNDIKYYFCLKSEAPKGLKCIAIKDNYVLLLLP